MRFFQLLIFTELLKYNLYFSGVRVGQAFLRTEQISDTVSKSVLLIRTEGFFDKIYPVRDSLVSYFHSQLFYTLRYERYINEANYKSVSIGEYRGDTVFYHDGSKIPLHSKTFDPISVIYFIRSRPTLDTLYNLLFHVGKVSTEVQVKVSRTQDKDFLWRIYIDLRSPKKSKVPGETIYYLASFGSRPPVRLEFRSNYGTFVAKLKEWE